MRVGKTVNAEARLLPDRVAPVARAVKQHQGLVTASLFTLWPDTQGEPMISPHLLERRPFLRRGDFAPGSRGQANVDTIAPYVDVAVFKVAYSAFFNTQLDWVLRRAGVDTVAVCGIVTNGGVASTVRDGLAWAVDLYADPINQVDSARWSNSARALRLVDQRAALLDSTRMVEDAALDPYLFVRDIHLQRRESRINDGKTD